MHCGERAAALLREWPPPKRRELLGSRELNAPTECCLIEVRGGTELVVGLLLSALACAVGIRVAGSLAYQAACTDGLLPCCAALHRRSRVWLPPLQLAALPTPLLHLVPAW